VRTGHGPDHRDRVATLAAGHCRIEIAETVAEAVSLYLRFGRNTSG